MPKPPFVVVGVFPSDEYDRRNPPSGEYLLCEARSENQAKKIVEHLRGAWGKTIAFWFAPAIEDSGPVPPEFISGQRTMRARLARDHSNFRQLVNDIRRFAKAEGIRLLPAKRRRSKPAPTESAAGTATGSPNPKVDAPMKAFAQYADIERRYALSNPTDGQVYEILKREQEATGESDLPTFDTWTRNLRKHRKDTGQSKSSPRAGRQLAGGVSAKDLHPDELPSSVQPRKRTRPDN